VTLPATLRGLARAGRQRADFQVTCPVFVVTGRDAASHAASRSAVCKQIAFYGSTPAYRPVLESVGRGALQTELNRLSKEGQWDEMGRRIDDELLDAFAVVGEPHEIAGSSRNAMAGCSIASSAAHCPATRMSGRACASCKRSEMPRTRRIGALGALALWSVCSAPALAEGELSARQIMERVDARDDGDKSTQDLEMVLIDKRGAQRVRKLRAYGRDVGPDEQSICSSSRRPTSSARAS